MAENSVQANGTSGKGDAGIYGRRVTCNIEDAKDFLEGLTARLGFIENGLRAENSDCFTEGAANLITDLTNQISRQVDTLAEAMESGHLLAQIAEGQAPILPDNTTEEKLFNALKGTRRFGGMLESDFICKAGLEAARIYRERFMGPKLPGKEEEAEAVQAAMDSLDLPKEQATA